MPDTYPVDAVATDVEIEDIGSNPDPRETIGELVDRRLTRRAALRGLGGAAAAATLADQLVAGAREASAQVPMTGGPSSLTFPELRHQLAQRDAVAEGYEIQVLLRWGDAVLPDAPAFDPAAQTPAAQAMQFGYNNDFIDFQPLPQGSRSADRGLLVVNHEYSNAELMFPGLGAGSAARNRTTAEQVKVEMMAHGLSVVEIARTDGRWAAVADSRFNRRITGETPMRVSGPAAGHDWLKTSADPTGTRVLGTLNNCAGGNTPWGTILTTEENFNYYFSGAAAKTGPQAEAYRRYGIVERAMFPWGRFETRFDLDKEPNEPNRFGWIVEFDPYDPQSQPVKRTALGRFKHEGCTHVVNPDGRVVLYSGDDERFDYVYKFVTARPWNPNDRAANRDLLDDGTLFVARFADDGKVQWLPLTHGEGPLTPANGFPSQAEVMINARRAADLLGATPMDRPEDVETNPVTGRTYVILTNNGNRREDQVSPVNPRARNAHGHIIEIVPPAPNGRPDHAATEARWEVFLLAGRPGQDAGARYHRATSDQGWLSCPDNCAFDAKGRIWISTDGAPGAAGVADGLYAADTQGPGRALTRLFYQAPTGAEVCGPCFTPDDTTIFLAIQHPAEDRGSSFDRPSTRWPDFQDAMPPRPSVIAIVKRGEGTIGE
ncbi:PhoX family phosphatase [Roseomonas terrae]|jgi:secreted PhoX family phosphatase|uniref:PhoX family phosphatase n=1 Tax=Neoroseomonas terrae TaxID=424799 RepID=A0ABS5EG94_9PROT|nr:PhoX family phosphatase [Neoroseomonas terrae]MBR0650000.1 PhoX family phosphatase [Neoroseomonas terrae]